ncbi:MAG: hypothetical protein JW982_05965 [Spirochaetes bacterium]|nr:hypothetical protein [Spirochaetota bacterium]
MKFFKIIIFIILLISPLYAEDSVEDNNTSSVSDQYVEISKIRIIIDEKIFEWTEGELIQTDTAENDDVAESNITLKSSTIISFLSIKPGRKVKQNSLEELCRDSELRLNKSGYFYSASVMIVPPVKNPDERTVIVTVTSGYFWRYSGGNAWGMIGKAGLFGDRASFYLFAGWNKNGFEYMHYRAGGIPLILGARAFYFGPGDYAGKRNDENGNRFESAATAGWFLHPDLIICADLADSGFGPDSKGLVSFQPYIRYEKFLKTGTDSNAGFETRSFIYPSLNKFKAETGGFVHAGLTGSTVFAFALSGGYSPDDLTEDICFDLFYTEDRNVRSGYEVEQLSASDYLLGSAELRQTVLTLKPAGVECRFQTFLFADAAGLHTISDPDEMIIADAYGAGFRILFENPVFARFTFSYGINRDINGRFFFCGTAGF